MKDDQLEKAHWLWLAAALGPASPHIKPLLEYIDEDIFSLPQACRGQELGGLLPAAQLRTLRRMCPEDYIARLDECREKNVSVVTWGEEEYPQALREIYAPPPALYYRGDITVANRGFLFAIIGTRRPSAYGVEATAAIAKTLAEAGIVLVSGLAAGLDGECHRAAVRAGTPTVACLAFGHTRCYPKENARLKSMIEQQGLTISEYPPDVPPMQQSFLQRNRLIAGLSKGVCVAEARTRSGTLNTVHAALDANRDVFSVPGSIFSPLSEGTNRLLSEGAFPVTCGGDILEHYGLLAPQEKKPATPKEKAPFGDAPTMSEEARKMHGALSASAALPLETLCEKSGLEPKKALAALAELEMEGKITRLAGSRYQLR